MVSHHPCMILIKPIEFYGQYDDFLVKRKNCSTILHMEGVEISFSRTAVHTINLADIDQVTLRTIKNTLSRSITSM